MKKLSYLFVLLFLFVFKHQLNSKVYDCFLFSNELEILEIK